MMSTGNVEQRYVPSFDAINCVGYLTTTFEVHIITWAIFVLGVRVKFFLYRSIFAGGGWCEIIRKNSALFIQHALNFLVFRKERYRHLQDIDTTIFEQRLSSCLWQLEQPATTSESENQTNNKKPRTQTNK